jgi:HPr kinase/phosphorylase
MDQDPSIETERSLNCQLHAVLVRVFETGVVIIGDSGIGKSECALDLVTRGHRLVADDAVEIYADSDKITGVAPKLTRHLLEIRGLGIIDVGTIFGSDSVCAESSVDLCVELRKLTGVDRLENVVSEYRIAGRGIPKFMLPVSSGRNLATLVETAVRLYRKGAIGSATARLMDDHAKLINPA